MCNNKDKMKSIPHGDQSCGILSNLERVSRFATPFWHKDHLMNRIRKICRVNRRQSKPYGILYRSRLIGYLRRDAGVSWNTTPRHFYDVFLPDCSYHPFPQSSFFPVRLQSSFARWKQEACHGIQHLRSICRRKIQSFRISPRSWPRWGKTQMWSTATIMWQVSS